MDSDRLQDLISRGLGTAARQIGSQYDAFRATSHGQPLAPANRFLRLPAAFSSDTTSFRQPVGYGHPTWSGIFDTAYTRVGDYLRGSAGTFYIAAQQSLLPSLCVLANRSFSVFRATTPQELGAQGYSGITRATRTLLLDRWPGSIVAAGARGSSDLPGEAGVAAWSILLPVTPVDLRPADLLRDENGDGFILQSAEYSALGWRITARQAEI